MPSWPGIRPSFKYVPPAWGVPGPLSLDADWPKVLDTRSALLSGEHMRIPRLSLCTFCALLGALSLRANPLGGTVVPGGGAASFSSSLGNLTINQTTPRVIINWQNFSIAAGET